MGSTTTACLIDDQGRVWDAHSWHLRGTRDTYKPSDDVTALLVKTGGCIRVEVSARFVRLFFNPHNVSPVAVTGMLYFIHDRQLHRDYDRLFCLTTVGLDGATRSVVEIYRSVRQIVNRLQFLVAESNADPNWRFTRRQVNPGLASRTPALARLIEHWRNSDRAFDAVALSPILERELGGRYTLFKYSPTRQAFAFMAAGPSMTFPDTFKRNLAGCDLAAMPDGAYGRWVDRQYHGVLRSGQPNYCEIDAQVFWPETGLVVRRYRRLLLPYLDASGCQIMLSVNRPL